ncbi:retropepsin-like aspartic protease [Brevundimonas faecalis]|uniref:retropepsin-like aspartic protease n=1 Tax=Brevundimonas faecalis TaxID=947378 RepID=UPI00362039C4
MPTPAIAAFTRRRALGLAASSLLWPVAARSQEPPSSPIEDRLIDNLLTRIGVEVDLGGGRRSVFVIDTGAERTSVSDRLAREIGWPPGPEVIVHGITAAQRTATVALPRLKVLQQSFDHLSAPVFSHDLLGADGFLGLDVLARFRLSLDFQRQRAVLAPSGRSRLFTGVGAPPLRRVNPALGGARRTRNGQLLLSSVETGGGVIDAFIDSGAQYSVGNRALAALAGPEEGRIQLLGVVGGALSATQRSLPDLRIARRRFGLTSLLFADLHAFNILGLVERPAILLGADLLTRFRRIMLDYGEGRIAFDD